MHLAWAMPGGAGLMVWRTCTPCAPAPAPMPAPCPTPAPRPALGTHGNPDFLGGWPSVFYVCGGLGICWYVLWLWAFTSNPEDDPWVSAAELAYITRGIATSPSSSSIQAAPGGETEALLGSGGDGGRTTGAGKTGVRPAPMPVYEFMTSGALWAIVVGNFVSNWGFYNLLTCMPQYMKVRSRTELSWSISHAVRRAVQPYTRRVLCSAW